MARAGRRPVMSIHTVLDRAAILAPVRSTPLAVLAVGLALVLAGCGSDKGGGSSNPSASATTRLGEQPGATVAVKDLAYQPRTVTVKKGQVVAWQFDDGSIPHDVKLGDVQSPSLKNETWLHRFDKTGTYSYTCTIHPFMSGKVVVTG